MSVGIPFAAPCVELLNALTSLNSPPCIVFLFFPQAGKFLPGQTFDPNFHPWTDAPITPEECFEILDRHVRAEPPSFLLFHNFLAFMYAAFRDMSNYGLFKHGVIMQYEGLSELQNAFTSLLIETSKDFSQRNVGRGQQFIGDDDNPDAVPPPTSAAAPAEEDGLLPASSPALNRTTSAKDRQEAEELMEAPMLGRQDSQNLINRFESMRTWEDTEHPIVLWYKSPGR